LFSNISISKKLWLLALSIVLIFILTFYFYFTTNIENQFKDAFSKKGLSLVQASASNLGTSLYANDSVSIISVVKGIENDPDIEFIIISDNFNEIKYQYTSYQELKFLSKFHDFDELVTYTDSLLIVKQSIFHRDTYQGKILVGFNLNWIKSNMAQQQKSLIIVSLILLFVFVVFITLLSNEISKPLKEAAEIIKGYTNKSGAFDLRLPVKGKDEIAQLAKALNYLADNLDTNILELNRSKKYLQTLFQLNPIPILIADTLGEIEAANDIACHFFGIDHDLLIQMNLESFIEKEDLSTIFNKIIEDKHDVRGYVTSIVMTDRSKKVVELSVSSYVDDSNLIKNVIVAAIDITEKIQIQREILQNQSKLQRINSELTQKSSELEKLSDINKKNANSLEKLIFISHQMMRVIDSKDILKTLLENSGLLMEAQGCIIFLHDKNSNTLKPHISFPKDIINRFKTELKDQQNFLWKTYTTNEPHIHSSSEFSDSDKNVLQIKSNQSLSILSLPISEKDYYFGVIVYTREGHNPFRPEELHLLNTLANQTAILLDNRSLMKALEEKALSLENAYGELQRSQQQVIQLQKMESLGTLVGGIAHDFNNILGIILPNTDLIKNEYKNNPELIRRVNVIANATQRAADLTRQLLMFSRDQDIQLQIISPNNLVKRISDMLKRTLGKEYDIILKLDDKILDIEGDENRLTQVLINLALNARDSMVDGGEIEIKTGMKKYSDNSRIKKDLNDFVCITMRDNGCGIKSSNLDKIFDPFFTTKSVGKGTGLGLSVVYGIMKSHKGFVEVESEIDKGTIFYLYFPPSRRKYLELDSDNGNRKLQGSEKIFFASHNSFPQAPPSPNRGPLWPGRSVPFLSPYLSSLLVFRRPRFSIWDSWRSMSEHVNLFSFIFRLRKILEIYFHITMEPPLHPACSL